MRKTKEKKKLSKGKKALIQYSIIGVCAISIGITSGIILKKKIGPVETDYAGFDPETFTVDGAALLEEYNRNKNRDFTPAELVNIGLEKYRQCENCYSIAVGLADTIVKQSIRNFQIKNGDQHFEEQISKSSMVSLSIRTVQLKSDEVELYRGKAKEVEVSEYQDAPEVFEPNEFKQEFGKRPSEIFIYLICDQTVIDEGTQVTKEDGKIKVELNLDPDIASYNYKKQMKAMSNLAQLPTFEYLKQT